MPQEQPQTMTIGDLAAKALIIVNKYGSGHPVHGAAGECIMSVNWVQHRREIVIDMADPIVFELDEEGE